MNLAILVGVLLVAGFSSAAVLDNDHARDNTIIVPGLLTTTPHWNDTDGNRIEAHAAGMLQDANSGRWFWYGESKKTSDLNDHGVNCYSAASLGGPWKFEGQVIHQSMIPSPLNGSNGPFIVERPKVLYNELTKKYVCWFHLDTAGYKFRHVGVFTADNPAGPFTYIHALRPDGIPSLDMSLFKDPVDKQAYFIRSCDNSYAGISRLTPDYLNSTGLISTHEKFEGMALFRHPNKTYYMMTSHLTGWNPNPLMLLRADGPTLDDPQWVNMGNPTNSPTSYNSQPTYVVQMEDKNGQSYFMYMADNWVHGGPNGLIDASYIWLPIKFEPTDVVIPYLTQWDTQDPFAPAPPPPPCPVSSGSRLQLTPCATPTNHAAVTWHARNGSLALTAGATKLCAAAGQNDGLVLAPCASNAQQAVTFAPGNTVHLEGLCFDVTWCGTKVCDGDFVALYKCGSPHPNQKFSFNATSGLLKSFVSGNNGQAMCVAAC
eukprot:m.294371 g.294371  ORF g.294371 m.294371 type:complete len:487 (+) comp20032_c0_seq2:54-1514(+)